MDYWESLFNHSYLRWFDLESKPSLCKIERIERDVEMMDPHRKRVVKKVVMHLSQIKGAIKNMRPMVLNITNARSIAMFLGERPSEWVGEQIVLEQGIARSPEGDVPCITVRQPQKGK